MIDGDINEFINGLYYGDERVFLYKNKKYFVQGLTIGDKNHLMLDRWEPPAKDYIWERTCPRGSYPVKAFLTDKLIDGKTFWELEKDIHWVDC